MPCTISSGYTIPCLNGIGGIKAIYISAADAVDMPADVAFEVDAASGLVDIIGAMSVYKFELKRELSSMEVTTTHDANNGTTYDEQTLSCVFLKPEVADYDLLTSLAGRRNNTFVEDNDGTVYLLGAVSGLEVTTGTYATGTSYGDQKGFTLSLSGREIRTYYCAALADITGLTIA